MRRLHETWKKVALPYVVPVELGFITLVSLHVLSNSEHHKQEAKINNCAAVLGTAATQKSVIPPECNSFADIIPQQITHRQAGAETITAASYYLPARQDFVSETQRDETSSYHLDEVLTICGVLGVIAGGMVLAQVPGILKDQAAARAAQLPIAVTAQ